MSRFKDLCSSSDSDSQQETQQSYQRGRVRENKKITQITAKLDTNNKDQLQNPTIFITKKQQSQVKTSQPSAIPFNQWIEINSYKSVNKSSSLDFSQKFIRQNIKPAQQQMKHYLQKMKNTLEDRKKFTSALQAANRDYQKVSKRMQQIKTTDQYNSISLQKQQVIPSNPHPSSISTLQKLQSKIQLHLSNLMNQHHKTIQTLILCRKQIDNYFNKVKFNFLDINSILVYDPQTQTYQEYGIQQMYNIIQQADSIINEHTSFITKSK